MQRELLSKIILIEAKRRGMGSAKLMKLAIHMPDELTRSSFDSLRCSLCSLEDAFRKVT